MCPTMSYMPKMSLRSELTQIFLPAFNGIELLILILLFLTYSYNCSQPVPELIEAGARVHIKKGTNKQ